MSWQCTACETVNEDQDPSCQVCAGARARHERRAVPPAARPSPQAAANINVNAPSSPPPRTASSSAGSRILGALAALLGVAVVAMVAVTGSSHDDATTSASSAGSPSAMPAQRVAGVRLRRRSYGRFSVEVPTTWRLVLKEHNRGGFIETKWRSPTTPAVFAKVDYTPGFAGTPKQGADGVRNRFLRLDGYSELGYTAYSGGANDGWRWAFVYDGARKVDFFFASCDSGYALLGVAPPARYPRYAPIFEAMAKSLRLEC